MISVCMATYNGEKYIKQQLLSILDQLGPDDELIISDDGSTDQTISVVKSLSDLRIRFVRNKHIKGYTGNFENALSFVKGDVVFLTDQDDVWRDDKVSKTLTALESSDFVVSDAQVVNQNLELVSKSYFQLRKTKFGFTNSLIRCRYLGCCYAFNRKVLEKSLPFPRAHNMLPHDLWLALIAEFFFKVTYLKEPLIYYRRHEINASNGGGNSTNSLVFKLKFRMYAFLNILKAIYGR